MNATPSNSNGPKAFAGVVLIGAVIAGVYAMVEPMSQRIDFLERQLGRAIAAMERDDEREASDRNILAAFQERFREIETQFDGERAMRERDERDLLEATKWIRTHDRIIERRDAEQWERIKSLERIAYGRGGPP